MPEKPAIAEDDLTYCIAMVRSQAIDFYLADLLLPEEQRRAAFVLHAFHVEIVNITLGTQEPMAGEIRLQWWREVLGGERGDEAQGHPLARALLAILTRHSLPAAALQAKLDAHIFDLYSNPMESQTMLEGWCGETRSVLFQLVAMAGGAEPNTQLADSCGHAGVATGLVGILENMPLQRARQQVFIPPEFLTEFELSTESFLATPGAAHEALFQSVIGLAQSHFDRSQEKIAALEEKTASTFLPLALVPLYLRRASKKPSSIATGLSPIPQWRKQWIVWRKS